LEKNSKAIHGSNTQNPIKRQKVYGTRTIKSEVREDQQHLLNRNMNFTVNKPSPGCISPLSRNPPKEFRHKSKSPSLKVLSNMSDAQSAEGLNEKSISPLALSCLLSNGGDVNAGPVVRGETLEEDTNEILAHPLFPYVLRAINDLDSTNLPYMPLTINLRGRNQLITEILTDLLVLLEKRAIKKRRVLDGI